MPASIDNMFPMIYHGVCLDNNDPESMGRLKVFVPGVHPQALASNPSQLPWAVPLMPLWGGSYKNPLTGCLNSECGHTSVPFVEKEAPVQPLPPVPPAGSVPKPDAKRDPFLGAQLAVFFTNGDHNYPVYFGAFQSGPGWLSSHKDHHVTKTRNVTVEVDEGAKSKLITIPSIGNATRIGQYLYGPPMQDASTGASVVTTELPTRVHIAVSNTEQDGVSVSIELTGHVNIKVNGDLYQEVTGEKIETVLGNYHLNVSGDMYTNVEGAVVESFGGARHVLNRSRVTVTNASDSLVNNLGDHSCSTYGDHQLYATDGVRVATLGRFRHSDNGFDAMHGGSHTEYSANDRNSFVNAFAHEYVGLVKIHGDDGDFHMRGGVVGSTRVDMSVGPINSIETSPTVNRLNSAGSIVKTAVTAVESRITAAENKATAVMTELVTGDKNTSIGGWYESTIMGGLTNNVQGFFEEHVAGPMAEFFEGAKLSTILGVESTANASLSTKVVAAPFTVSSSVTTISSTAATTIASVGPMVLQSDANVVVIGKQIHLN